MVSDIVMLSLIGFFFYYFADHGNVIFVFEGHNMAEDYWHAGSRFMVSLSSLLLLLLLSVCVSAQRTLSSSGKHR